MAEQPSVEVRLEQLERAHRRWRAVAGVAFGLAITSGVLAWSWRPATQVDDHPGIVFANRVVTSELVIRNGPRLSSEGIMLDDADEGGRKGLKITSSRIEIGDEAHDGAVLGRGHLVLTGAEHEVFVATDAIHGAALRLETSRHDDGPRAVMSLDDRAGVLRFIDPIDKLEAWIGASQVDGTAFVDVQAADGARRQSLGVRR